MVSTLKTPRLRARSSKAPYMDSSSRKTCVGCLTELQAVKPAMSHIMTVQAGKRSAMGASFACLVPTRVPSFFLSPDPVSFGIKRSRTFAGNIDETMADVCKALLMTIRWRVGGMLGITRSNEEARHASIILYLSPFNARIIDEENSSREHENHGRRNREDDRIVRFDLFLKLQ